MHPPTSSQTTPSVAGPLAATLLPVLLHRMNNATQLLSTLNALASSDGETHWLEERSDDLAHASETIDRTGYLLAILACACGADLLLERRVTAGLELAVEAVDQVLRREGRSLAAAALPLPLLAPDVKNGWELPWTVASLLLQAGRGLEQGGVLDWRFIEEDRGWVLAGAASPPDRFESIASAIERRLPEGELDVRRDGWSWRIPATWLSRCYPPAHGHLQR